MEVQATSLERFNRRKLKVFDFRRKILGAPRMAC